METASPLTRDIHESFQPKIGQLYASLFTLSQLDNGEDSDPSEGFWREFFLLPPSKQKFCEVLESFTADDLLQIRHQTQQFFRRAITEFVSGKEPQDGNALENLTAFLAAVLAKRYTNPSTDVIEVLAGLENVDKVMHDLVNGLEAIISKSQVSTLRRKALDCATAAVAGSYQTSLVAYFIHKDFFHSLMQYVKATPESAPAALSLLGLLANYNKFEAQNVYQSRMEDFINEDLMVKLVEGFANVCGDIRDAYVAVHDDAPVPWSIGATLSYVGLRSLTPESTKPSPPTEEEAKMLFNRLPPASATAYLAVYSFVQANNVFASQLISTDKDDDLESPLAAILSATSYLCHHAFRSVRVQHFSLLALFTIRLLIQDAILAKRLSSPELKIEVRLARQRAPHLPQILTPRIPTTIILDLVTDTLSHNLRKKLSVSLYSTCLTILHALLTQLSTTRTRLAHHWSYIWLSLLSLLRFLTTYSTDLLTTTRLIDLQTQILTQLTSILAFSLLRGDNFLPDPPSYDDLFYKLLEASETLTKFQKAYDIPALPPTNKLRHATDALISISSHYRNLLPSSTTKPANQTHHQSPREIQKLIGQGHETLGEVVDTINSSATVGGTWNNSSSVGGGGSSHNTRVAAAAAAAAGTDEFGHYEKWRETNWKSEMKKIIRTVVEDGRVLAVRSVVK